MEKKYNLELTTGELSVLAYIMADAIHAEAEPPQFIKDRGLAETALYKATVSALARKVADAGKEFSE